jgi:cation:H+ antiporter
MTLNLLLCVVGFILLYFSADWLVKGSSGLARSLGVTPLVIGLTVVAFGTSAPELVVSLVSSIQGKNMIAVGNVVGSNICNIALVLGISALFQPIISQKSVIQREIPIMLGVSLVLLIFSLNSTVGTLEGVILFTGVILYIVMSYRFAVTGGGLHKENEMPALDNGIASAEPSTGSRPKQIFLIFIGIAGVILGAQLVVDSAIMIMQVLGVSEKFIGLTIVAFGTSLPELATSVVAAIRKEMDISIGNLVGSNIFNILSVIGATAIVGPIHLPGGFVESGLVIDYLVMIFISFLPWVMMRKNYTMNRAGGGILLSCYAGYFTYLLITL